MIRPSELMEAERIYFLPPPKCVLLRPPRGLSGGRERILLVFFPDFARGARRASKDLEATEQSISRRHSSEEFHRVKIFCNTFALRSVTPRISNLGFLSPVVKREILRMIYWHFSRRTYKTNIKTPSEENWEEAQVSMRHLIGGSSNSLTNACLP